MNSTPLSLFYFVTVNIQEIPVSPFTPIRPKPRVTLNVFGYHTMLLTLQESLSLPWYMLLGAASLSLLLGSVVYSSLWEC